MDLSSYVKSITEVGATVIQVSPENDQRTLTQIDDGPSSYSNGSPGLASPSTIKDAEQSRGPRFKGNQSPSPPKPEKRALSPRPMGGPLCLDRRATARSYAPDIAGVAPGATERHAEEGWTGRSGRKLPSKRPHAGRNLDAIPNTLSTIDTAGMLFPTEVHKAASSATVQGAGVSADMERELPQEKHHGRDSRRSIKTTEGRSNRAKESMTFLDKPDLFDRPYNGSGAAGEDLIEARGAIGFVSTELMDSFILELNPEARSDASRLPPPASVSPRQGYPHEVQSTRALNTTTRKLAEGTEAVQETTRTSGQMRLGKLGQSLEVRVLLKSSSNSGTIVASNGSTLSLLSVGRGLTADVYPTTTPTVGIISDIVAAYSPASGSARQHIPTIDEIVKRHAGAAKAASDRAHSSVRLAALATFGSLRFATAPSSTPSLSPGRSTYASAVVGVIPPRSPSIQADIHHRPSTDSTTSSVAASQELLNRLTATEDREEMQDDPISVKPFLSPTALLRPASAQSRSPSPSPLRRLPRQAFGESPPSMSSSSATEAPAHALAVYLHSPRLTRMLTVSSSPSLNVSLADVGSPGGRPIFVFLGLGSVRYLVALFDELAVSLGLRLICIDRWGLGKSDDAPVERRGLLEWARVVEYVADELKIPSFGLLAHSAGAPYALATALRLGSRVVGTVHLLSPWVDCDVDGGYKWLKWVPNSVIKTAQAAEWRLQSWALGKPPPITYGPIGFNAYAPVSSASLNVTKTDHLEEDRFSDLLDIESRFDDLADTGGSYGPKQAFPHREPGQSSLNKRVSGGFLRRLFQEQAKQSPPLSPNPDQTPAPSPQTGRSSAYKNLVRLSATPTYSDGSFSPASASLRSVDSRRERPASVCLPVQSIDRLDYDGFGIVTQHPKTSIQRSASISSRSSGQADSFSNVRNRHKFTPPLERAKSSLELDGAAFGTALLQASHAESLAGGTSDLMAILGRDSRPWGFSYTDIEQPCKIWYGANDDKISEKSMRWCERCMDAELVVVPNEGHSLITSSRVMVEVLESLAADSR